MLSVGITGGMGSGKSTVCRVFETLGISVFNADEAARNLQNHNADIQNSMMELLGKEIFSNGILSRKLVAEKIFADNDLLKKLNSIIHPATIHAFNNWKKKQFDKPYLLKEAAILFESGANAGLDKIILVTAPFDLKIKRIKTRDGLSQEQILQRTKYQTGDDEKVSRSDFVIINDEQKAIIPQVIKVHQALLNLLK